MKILKKIIILIFTLTILHSYFNYTTSSDIIINETGEIIGLTNDLRNYFQGLRFWESQLEVINKKIDYLNREPERKKKFENEMQKFERRFNSVLEESYAKDPSLRPSPTAQKASELRNLAQQIEWEEIENKLEKNRLHEIERLNRIKNIIIKKINKFKKTNIYK